MPHLLALTLAPETRAVLFSIAKILFILFIVGSFVNVAVYAVARVRQGPASSIPRTFPLPVRIQPPFTGWIFIICVIGLIYMQSVLFPIMVMFGIGMAAVQQQQENGRSSSNSALIALSTGRAVRYGLFVFGASCVLVVTPLNEAWSQDSRLFPPRSPGYDPSVQTFRSYTKTAVIVSFPAPSRDL